jgi:Uma2 family endonuclease
MPVELEYSHRSWTYEDLEQLPDDGHRYEILDGQLLVTPPPSPEHQDVVNNVLLLLARRLPHGDLVGRPKTGVGVRTPLIGLERYVIPDACVVDGPRPPLYYEPQQVQLALEVTSPRTITIDRGLKRQTYAEHGIAHYWLVDLKDRALRAFSLVDGDYELAWSLTDERAGREVLQGVTFADLTREV